MIDLVFLSKALTDRYGLEVRVREARSPEGRVVSVSPSGIPHTIGFHIDYLLGWRRVSASFIPGNYAYSLTESIKACSEDQKAVFELFARSLLKKGAKISVKLDGVEYASTDVNSWPLGWTGIRIEMSKLGVIEVEQDYNFEYIFPFVCSFLGLCLSLLPLEQYDLQKDGEEEGAFSYSIVKHYERSRMNRAACIEIHGTDCSICGFNFGAKFGKWGEGLIQVHHIVPVSLMNGSYKLNPGKDLIPVCPNCHAMLHSKTPPYFPEELRQLLQKENPFA